MRPYESFMEVWNKNGSFKNLAIKAMEVFLNKLTNFF